MKFLVSCEKNLFKVYYNDTRTKLVSLLLNLDRYNRGHTWNMLLCSLVIF